MNRGTTLLAMLALAALGWVLYLAQMTAPPEAAIHLEGEHHQASAPAPSGPNAGAPSTREGASGPTSGSRDEESSLRTVATNRGLWLVGGPPKHENTHSTRISVEHPRTGRAIQQTARSTFTIPVTNLISGDERASILRATIAHPRYLEHSVSILIEPHVRGRSTRQRVEIRLGVEQEPATRLVRGHVHIPGNARMANVHVALMVGVADGAIPELLATTHPQPGGAFELPGILDEEMHLVAWSNATPNHTALRPTTIRLAARARPAKPVTLRLEAGSRISGRIRHEELLAAAQLRLEAKLDADSVPTRERPLALPREDVRSPIPEAIDEGQSEELLESFLPKRTETRDGIEVNTIRRRFIELSFAGGGFEFTTLPIHVRPDGKFAVTGLCPLASYGFGRPTLLIDGQPAGLWPDSTRTWLTAQAPTAELEIPVQDHLFLLRIATAAGPLRKSVVRFGQAQREKRQSTTDRAGRVFFRAPGPGRFEIAISRPGRPPHESWITANRWHTIQL